MHPVDRQLLAETRVSLAAGRLSADAALIHDPLEPPVDIVSWPTGPERTRLEVLGQQALARGECAVAVVAGGMATRFGGGVKATVPVKGNHSFLMLKLRDAKRWRAPFVVMTSFATHERVVSHLADEVALTFEQGFSYRMQLNGDLCRDADGQPSRHATGHGDFFWAMHAHGAYARLQALGVKTIFFSNVDNLGAMIDPALLALHLESDCALTAEVVERAEAGMAESRAAAIACVTNHRTRLVEGIRLPDAFPLAHFRFLSINSFLLRLASFASPIWLEPLLVRKEVNGTPVLQLERIACEVTALEDVSCQCVRVPALSRFLPVKTQGDLDVLRKRLEHGDLANAF